MTEQADAADKAARAAAPVSPASWYADMPSPHATDRLEGATLRCFDGTGPTIEQPALDENVVAIHLGPKRITRWQGPRRLTWNVPSHAITRPSEWRQMRKALPPGLAAKA